MNEAQALNICGYFAKGLEARFVIGDKDYLICKIGKEEVLVIHGPGDDELDFGIMDMSVNDSCLVIDLYDFQMRIDLEDDAE